MNLMKKKLLTKILILINIIFFSLFLYWPSELINELSQAVRNTKNILTITYLKQRINFNDGYMICEIPTAKAIKPSTIIISGHVYNDKTSTHIISDKLMELIISNQSLIDGVYLTGDIFFEPSEKDWDLLNNTFRNLDIQLQVAPGNHDIGFNNSTKKEIFKKSNQYNYPFVISSKSSVHIFDDTTVKPWSYQDKAMMLAADYADINKNLFLFGHHITIKELLFIANSNEGKPSYIAEFNSIVTKLSPLYKNIYLIAGDTGAFEHLPTSLCINYNNVFYLAQGIKSHGQNEVLLLNNNQLSKIKL